MKDTDPTAPVYAMVAALQAVAEALSVVSEQVKTPGRWAFDSALLRLRQSRVELLQWLDEQR